MRDSHLLTEEEIETQKSGNRLSQLERGKAGTGPRESGHRAWVYNHEPLLPCVTPTPLEGMVRIAMMIYEPDGMSRNSAITQTNPK